MRLKTKWTESRIIYEILKIPFIYQLVMSDVAARHPICRPYLLSMGYPVE